MLLPLALLAGNSLFAHDLTVCLRNEARLDADTLAVFERELTGISTLSGLSLRLLPCAGGPAGLRLTIQTQSLLEPSALGAARTQGPRVLPEVELYAKHIAALLPAQLPSLMGRAMARVAAHEIGHYLLQRCDHGGELMAEAFTGARLIAGNRQSFRIPLRSRP